MFIVDEPGLYALAAQKGDPEALAQLWQRVKDYAYKVVMRYTVKPYAETEDYMQTAFLGVRAAALAYDPSRGSFLTLADMYIRSACRHFYHWNRHGEVQTISYDVPMNADDPDGGDFRDSFPDTSIRDPAEGLECADMVRDVRAAVDELNPRHREIIEQKYYHRMPLEAVCQAQGVSAERIRQIEQSALKHLRASKHLVSYRRYYAPTQGVGVIAFRNYGESAVERVAIKNVDKERRAEYRAFRRHVLQSVENGLYSPEVGEMIIRSYEEQRGLLANGQNTASVRFID
ncbi:MAG: sigma-70 family RNA polymerase sigma factor [Clostridia bacterium]|nr:sigma-70 family RNA polymerase sigma factor [Clostridia bacterium]